MAKLGNKPHTRILSKYVREHMVNKGLFDKDVLDTVLEKSKKLAIDYITLLLDECPTQQYEILEAASDLYGVLFVSDASVISIDNDLTIQTGLDKAEEKHVFVVNYAKDNKSYLVAPSPSQDELINGARNKLDFECPVMILSPDTMKQIVSRDLKSLLVFKDSQKLGEDNSALLDAEILDLDAKATGVRKVFIDILNAAIAARASDIHMVPLSEDAVIKFRIDGHLIKYTNIPLSALRTLKNLCVNLSRVPVTSPHKSIDGKFQVLTGGVNLDIRLSIIPLSLDDSDIVMRLLYKSNQKIEDLGYSEDLQHELQQRFKMTKGVVLIAGPTGCGKTSTLYAGVRASDHVSRKFCSVEDPVEQEVEGITQVSVNELAGVTFESTLKAFLRHDPDVIIVGEIRDVDVAKACMDAATTGHLTLTSVHANDCFTAIARLNELEVTHTKLSKSLAFIMSQRLVRRVCSKCAETYKLDPDHYWRKIFKLGDGEIELIRGKGCPECHNTGYYGRIAIVEYLSMTRELRAALAAQKSLFDIEQMAREQGFITFLEDGVAKALEKITTFEELESLAADIV